MTESDHSLLVHAAQLAADYRAGVAARPVKAPADTQALRKAFARALPEHPTPPSQVIDELVEAARDGLTATVGPRYFGFVIGGALPAASAADVLTLGWEQCAYNEVLSPASAAAERAAASWLKDLLALPESASVGFVTGAQAANTVGLAVGRHKVLADAGWDVEQDGLIGAPRIRVLAGTERHATIDRALRLIGLGMSSLEAVPALPDGSMNVGSLRAAIEGGPPAPMIVCLQAGGVNTGAFDDFSRAIPLAHDHGAWVHVDGAFGLWAAANPATASLTRGLAAADSWGTDAHKWLNVPYDSGLSFCAHPEMAAATMAYSASYLSGSGRTSDYVLGDLTPESSRRARGFAVWAALRELGRSGVADLVERCCQLARQMASLLRAGGATIHNDVVLNQVLVSFGDASKTDAIIEVIQQDGICWLGGTTFRGERLIRISVSNWSTMPDDIQVSAEAILRCARAVVPDLLRGRFTNMTAERVRASVREILSQSPAFRSLPADTQEAVHRSLVDPALERQGGADRPAVAADPEALRALVDTVDFPEFVADLIKGVFDANLDAMKKQTDAYLELMREATRATGEARIDIAKRAICALADASHASAVADALGGAL